MPRAKPFLLISVALAALFVGCTKSDPVDPVDPAQLRAQFEKWCAVGPVALGQSTTGAKIEVAIEISPREVSINSEPAKFWRDRIAEFPPGSTWSLIPDPNASVAEVVRIAEAVAERLGPKGLVYFANPNIPRPESPYPTESAAALAELNAVSLDQRGNKLAEMLEKAAGDCEAFDLAMRAAGHLPTTERCPALTKTIPDALAGCRVDSAQTVAILYLLMVGDAVWTEFELEIATAESDGALEFEYGMDQLWNEVGPGWFETPPTRPIRFRERRP